MSCSVIYTRMLDLGGRGNETLVGGGWDGV